MRAINIIVVALLTCLIFTLAFVSFRSIIKSEKVLVSKGEKDSEILKEEADSKKKSSKIINILSLIVSFIIMGGLISVVCIEISFKAQKDQLAINNKIQLVIVSDSMDGFYSEEYRLTLPEDAKKDHFKIGDLLAFDKVDINDELEIYKVYGYKDSKGRTITHRLIGIKDSGLLVFRGDNTAGRDDYVKREQVILRYTNKKIEYIGLFILFAQSGFGIYALVSSLSIYMITDIFAVKYKKMIQERLKLLKNKGDVLIPNYSKGRRVNYEK